MVLKNQDRKRITSDNVSLSGYRVVENGELYKPQAVKLRRGPYNIHMSIVQTPSDINVQQIKVEKRRPALFGPEKFANMRVIRSNSINNIEQLEEI